MEPQDHKIAFGDGIKALDAHGKRYGGYLVHFNTPDESDLHGERFIADTNFMLKTHPLEGKPVLFHHGLDDSIGAVPLGKIDTVRKDAKGIYIEFNYKFAENYREYMQELGNFDEWSKEQDELLAQYEDYIAKRLQNKVYKFSSGALPSGVKTADDGTILQWPMIEGSATPTPAEQRGRTVISAKALLPHLQHFSVLQAQHQTEDNQGATMPTVMPDGQPDIHSPSGHSSTEAKSLESDTVSTKQEGIKMDREELFALFREFLAEMGIEGPAEEDMEAMAAATEEMVAEDEEEQKAISIEDVRSLLDERFDDVASKFAQIIAHNDAQRKAARKDKFEEKMAAERQKAQIAKGQPESKVNPYHNPQGAQPTEMRDLRYDHWTTADYALAATLANQSRAKGLPMNIRTDEAFWRGFADSVSKSSLITHKTSGNVMRAVNAIKANELDHSTQTGYGDEWVPTVWSNEILERARQDNVILPLVRNVDMPSNPHIMPVESTDPSVYYVAETTAENQLTLADSNSPIPDSKIATTNITLTAAKLGTRTGISAELQEDGVPGTIPMYRRQAERVLANTIDNLILNADSATSNNVNYDGGTPTATNPHMSQAKGMVKSALVSNGVNAQGAAPTLAKIRQARFALQNGSISAINDLAIIADNQTYSKLLGMDEFVTLDKSGPQATAQTGLIGFIDGIRVFATAELALASTNGKVSSTGGNNTLGRLLIVDTRYWYLGYRRQVTQTIEFLPYFDSWQMTTTVRLALVNQNDDHTAILYNIAV